MKKKFSFSFLGNDHMGQNKEKDVENLAKLFLVLN
jgi:hypothetical protein